MRFVLTIAIFAGALTCSLRAQEPTDMTPDWAQMQDIAMENFLSATNQSDKDYWLDKFQVYGQMYGDPNPPPPPPSMWGETIINVAQNIMPPLDVPASQPIANKVRKPVNIWLEWTPSPSTDIASYLIYGATNGVRFETNQTAGTNIELNAWSGFTNAFTGVAVASNGLVSAPSKPATWSGWNILVWLNIFSNRVEVMSQECTNALQTWRIPKNWTWQR